MLPTDNNAAAPYALPLGPAVLVYAPLQRVAALVNRAGAAALRVALVTGEPAGGSAPAATGDIADLTAALRAVPEAVPAPLSGPFSPLFLGLLPTRGCNLACTYCDFLPLDAGTAVMPLDLARDAVRAYIDLVARNGARLADIHYFGGEPFCAPEVIDLSVHAARAFAAARGLDVHFEVSTNGAFGERRARWVAETMDTVVLSLDGGPEDHDAHRPTRHGGGSFDTVDRTARILSEGPTELYLRCCVTADMVDRVPQIARRFCNSYRPAGVCFEPLLPTPQAAAAGLAPPDPWEFATQVIRAARILEDHGVEPVYAAADIRARRASFCPIGQDVPIVAPDGTVVGCYLLPREWEAQGYDFTLGRMAGDGLHLDPDSVERLRAHTVWNRPFCDRCFARWHCAGGCHVNHRLPVEPGPYDRLCIQTRVLALRNLLHALGRDDLVDRLLADQQALRTIIERPSDRLSDLELQP